MITISNHIRNQRSERLVAILTHIGLGEPVVEFYDVQKQHINVLTSTGVYLVYNTEKTTLITAYLATWDKVYAMTRINPVVIPKTIKTTIKKNEQKYSWIYKISA